MADVGSGTIGVDARSKRIGESDSRRELISIADITDNRAALVLAQHATVQYACPEAEAPSKIPAEALQYERGQIVPLPAAVVNGVTPQTAGDRTCRRHRKVSATIALSHIVGRRADRDERAR